MDNTYRPFFRDDLELDFNIPMPSLQIKPYRRQFISTNSQPETEDEEENAVTSEVVNETNTTANNVSTNTSESTLTENNNATLGDCLKKLKDSIHPAMKDAFLKLYGYTSDANGIRHANGLGEGDSTFAEAKYMLVSCSSFINYLSESIKKDD